MPIKNQVRENESCSGLRRTHERMTGKGICILVLILLVFVLPVSAINQTVGNWTFNEGNGTLAADTSGFGNNGTIVGADWSTDAINGYALSFNDPDTVIIPNSSTVSISSSQSFVGWIKPVLGNTERVITKGGTTWEYSMYYDNDNKLWYEVYMSNGSNHANINTSGLSNNTWLFFAATYQDGHFINISINNKNVQSSSSFYGVTNAGSEPLQFGGNNALQNLSGKLDEFRMFNYVINSSEITTYYQQVQPVPSYPTGGITIAGVYPPQTTSINFSWHDTEYPSDELIVAKDSAFNIIVVDTYTSNDYYDATLESGQTYYWKVRQYNLTTPIYGKTSATANFTISQTSVDVSGNTIHGIIYELKSGVVTPISDVKVKISNNYSTVSEDTTTGSNGYYQFTDLVNGTYYIQGSRIDEYEDSAIEIVTITGSPVKKDILMQRCVSGFNCFYNKMYVIFNVHDVNGSMMSDVDIKAYKYGSSLVIEQETTDSSGSAKLLLLQTQKYTIVFTKSGDSKTIDLIPTSTVYNILLGDILGSWNGMTYYLSSSNTSIWFNMTDPNSEITSLSLKFGNATNISINLTTGLSGTLNFNFTPANITVLYKVTYTFISVHYGTITAYRWIYIVGKQPTLPAVTNLPAWAGNILAFVVSFVILFSTKGERNMGIGIFLFGLSLGAFVWMGIVSSDVSGTTQWTYTIPLICIIGVLTQMTRRN